MRIIRSLTGDSVHEVTALNGRLYTAEIFGRGSAEIFDISNVGDPSQNVPRLGVIFPGDYAHTSWPTDDGQFVAVARERQQGDLSIWNISDPANPTLASRIVLPLSEAYCVHQVMIKGSILYASWYQAGVRAYDISDPYNPVLLGNYKTFDGPVSGFDGAWGEFMTDDGRFFASDMRTGVYIFELDALGQPTARQPFSGTKAKRLSLPAPVEVGLSGGVLHAILTRGNDTIVVARNTGTHTIEVTVDDSLRYSFAATEVLRLNLRATRGNNLFVLDSDLDLPTYIDGGPGENTVVGWPGTSPAISDTAPSVGHAHGERGSKYLAIGVQHIVPGRNSTASSDAALVDYSAHVVHTSADVPQAGFASDVLTMVGSQALLGGAGNYFSGHLMTSAIHDSGSLSSADMVGSGMEPRLMAQVGWHKPG